MANSSEILQQRVKVPENHEITIRIPDEIPVNSSVEIHVSIHDTRKKAMPCDPRAAPLETAILSESSLKKDWDRPEEDRAWANF